MYTHPPGALKGQHLLAQGKRPQGATPWVCCVFVYQRPERAKALQQGMNSIQYMKMLLALQAAIDDEYKTPRVSSHMVRLALGYTLLAFQAVPFLCLFRFLLTMHFWLFWPLYSSPLILCPHIHQQRPERAKALPSFCVRHSSASALKGQHLLAQGKRPQGATPWV